jgi:NADPH:quinone reductase
MSLPTEMIAYAAKKSGNPEEIIEKLTLPVPQIGERDLLVKNLASAVNPVDYKVLGGNGNEFNPPKVVGFDSVGTVVAVGEKVSFHQVGDKVYFSGTFKRSGSFAEYTAVDERIVGKAPTKWTNAEIASIPLVGLTAYEALFENIHISQNPKDNEGKSILIINGAGGVGSIASQLAKWAGLKVVSTASRKETIEFCKENGADFVLNHYEDLIKQTQAIDSLLGLNGGYDYCFSCVGDLGEYFDTIGKLMKPGGRVVSIETSKEGNVKLNGDWFLKRLTFSFEFMFSKPVFGYNLESQKEGLEKLAELIDSGVLKSTVSKTLKIEEVSKALEEVKSGKAIGKISLLWE